MYTKILVPLDGSKLAECALEHVETIASGCGTQEVILVSVTEKVKVKHNAGAPRDERTGFQVTRESNIISGQVIVPLAGTFVGDRPTSEPTYIDVGGRKYNQADRYLDRIQRRLIAKGFDVRTEVLLGSPAESIVDYAAEHGIDLIIMSSHGRSGISRWASGSVAERVFRASCVPVLMVRAPGCGPAFEATQ
jgi:nucleotide-binding universal stress UspA family protein